MSIELKFCFSIDEIYYLKDNIYMIKTIPYNVSNNGNLIFNNYPYNVKYFYVSAEMLDNNYLKWEYSNYNKLHDDQNHIYEGNGSVIQGGYYEFPYKYKTNWNKFDMRTNLDKNIFGEYRTSDKLENYFNVERISKEYKNIDNLCVDKSNNLNNVYLYAFKVGQGDMSLLITSEKNAYLIDCNMYSHNNLKYFKIIKEILEYHNVKGNRLKAIVVTHKHLDHIRGLDNFIRSSGIGVDNFIMNFDYHHNTIPVINLLESAKENIPCFINLNSPCEIIEGDTIISFKNPNDITVNAPNINDSSIVICVEYKNNRIYLTGDAGYSTLEYNLDCYSCIPKNFESVYKVSHHGSRTGTSCSLINNLNIKNAYISAGYSKKYNHPHKESLQILKSNYTYIDIFKNANYNYICFKCNGRSITKYY